MKVKLKNATQTTYAKINHNKYDTEGHEFKSHQEFYYLSTPFPYCHRLLAKPNMMKWNTCQN